MRLRHFSVLSGLALAAVIALPASASDIQLEVVGNAQTGANYIDFGNYPTDTTYTPAPGSGAFKVSMLNPGVFSTGGVTLGEFGAIQSLNEGTGPVTLPGPFMTFNSGGSNLQLWATNIPAGEVGPFDLTQTSNGVLATFDVDGYILNTTTDKEIDTFAAMFSMTFANQTLSSIFSDLPLDANFCADFKITPMAGDCVPEPSSMLLASAGILGLALARRRSRV